MQMSFFINFYEEDILKQARNPLFDTNEENQYLPWMEFL
ncbi:hypothetical protein OROMI_006796 [Orobanche minor]